jgi:hypothetical protein
VDAFGGHFHTVSARYHLDNALRIWYRLDTMNRDPIRPSFRSPLRRLALAAAALAVAACGTTAVQKGDPVPFPRGYRDWHHVKSMVIQPGHALHDAFGGIHHVYANPAAAAGLADGQFAEGSVLVFDLLAADVGGNAIQEGPRKVLGVMHKSSAAWPATGGWGFAGFTDGGDVVKDMAQQCFQCHQSQQAHGYVFSRPRS